MVQRFVLIHEKGIKEWTCTANFSSFWVVIAMCRSPYYSAYKKLNPSIKGASIHDLVVMSALVNPEYFKYLYREVEINVKTFFKDFIDIMVGRGTN